MTRPIRRSNARAVTRRTGSYKTSVLVALLFFGACALPPPTVVLNEVTSVGKGKIELYNQADHAIDLSGWTLSNSTPNIPGHSYKFPQGSSIAPHDYRVMIGGVDQVFLLGNKDGVILVDSTGLVADSVEYDSVAAAISYCRLPNGNGFWGPCPAPTFGANNDTGCRPPPPSVVLNEVRSSDGTLELYNTAGAAVDVSGWHLTDMSPDSLGHRYTVPNGTVMGPGEYLVLHKGKDHVFSPGLDDAVRLEGRDFCLLDIADYGPGQAVTSYCRIPNGTGPFGPCPLPSFGATNVGRCEAPPDVVINEVTSAGTESVELFNVSSAPVDLTGMVLTNTAPDAPGFLFAVPSSTLAPGGYVVFAYPSHLFTLGRDDAVFLLTGAGCVSDIADYLLDQAIVSYCRIPNGSGGFLACTTATFGMPNLP